MSAIVRGLNTVKSTGTSSPLALSRSSSQVSAQVPVLEPSDSQEAKDFTKFAFELSEKYDTPVILRMTTRVAHSQSLVTLDERRELPLKAYEKNIAKYVMMPANNRISRTHCELYYNEKRQDFVLKDVSKFGTFLSDGTPMEKERLYALKDKDCFYVVSPVYKFRVVIEK